MYKSYLFSYDFQQRLTLLAILTRNKACTYAHFISIVKQGQLQICMEHSTLFVCNRGDTCYSITAGSSI